MKYNVSNSLAGVSLRDLHAIQLRPRSHSRTDWSSDALKGWGQRLSKRVAYLLEPLTVLDIDDQGGAVQVRSQSLAPRDLERADYEIRLFRQGSLRMERVVFDETTRPCKQAPCQPTGETLERLADDIAASVG